jgi:hypothetical protein
MLAHISQRGDFTAIIPIPQATFDFRRTLPSDPDLLRYMGDKVLDAIHGDHRLFRPHSISIQPEQDTADDSNLAQYVVGGSVFKFTVLTREGDKMVTGILGQSSTMLTFRPLRENCRTYYGYRTPAPAVAK